MASRQNRSSSIPIPRSNTSISPSQDIESVISIPFASPTFSRSRLSGLGYPTRSGVGEDHRGPSVSQSFRASTSLASSPPIRPTARSFTHSSILTGRGSPRTFEPRVIRADSSRSVDDSCAPISTSPTRARRPSATSAKPLGSQRQATLHSGPAVIATASTSFPLPAYLEHSALRHLLHTDIPAQFTLFRKPEPAPLKNNFSYIGRSRRSSSPLGDSDEDDVSPPRELRSSTPSVSAPSSAIFRLPTRWCEEMCSPALSIFNNGRDLTFHGAPSTSDKEAAAARTNFPIPPACGIYYYEVEITSKSNKGLISIGFVGRDVKVSRLPGWEKNSWGYHGDDGSSFSATEKNGTPYGPQYGTGDIIGCGIDFSQHRAFFTKNGSFLGMVFENVGKDCDIYPAVGLRQAGEAIRANFGHEPFKFDIEDHVLQQRNQVWADIQLTPLKWPLVGTSEVKVIDDQEIAGTSGGPQPDSALAAEERVKVPINQLVLSYLSHHGYARTARAFESQCKARGGLGDVEELLQVKPSEVLPASSVGDDHMMDMDGVPPKPVEIPEGDIELRTRIVQSVIAGDVDTALTETRKHFPSVLEREQGLMLFKLRCRKFVELVLEAAELKKKMNSEDHDMCVEVDATMENDAGDTGEGMEVDEDASLPSAMGLSMTNGYRPTSQALPNKTMRKQSFTSTSQQSWSDTIVAQYGAALEKAVAYGQVLQSDYKDRPEVRAIFKRTSVIMAYDDPLEAGGDAAEVAGQGARVALATDMNQAILQSQGRPTHPALERIYRQTAACLVQLALMGVGAAAFADMPKEFLDA